MMARGQTPLGPESSGKDISAGEGAPVQIGLPELRVVPLLSVSERYDSNVFFIPGQNNEDFVTSMSPQVRVEHNGRLLTGSLMVGATAELYVNNPELNYLGVNGGLTLNLTNMLARILPRATLAVTDFVQVTPQLPAFLNPEAQAAGQPDTFARGIQPARANSIQNTVSVSGTYTFTPIVSLQASYSLSFLDFGKTFATPSAGGFYNTTSQSASLGVQARVTRQDSLSVSYTPSLAKFGEGSGVISSFSGHNGSLAWNHTWTPSLSGSLTAGATLLDLGTGSLEVAYTGTASVTWTARNTPVSLSYSRGVSPSYFSAGTALVSNVVTSSASYPLTALLSISGSANYAYNESTADAVPLSFQSYGGTVGLSYALTRMFSLNASYNYNRFDQSSGGIDSTFDRQLATLTISGAWNQR